jgi:threonyl-tRNA synthetase
MTEVQGFLRLLDDVYSTFGLEYSMALSTRPESYLVSGGGGGGGGVQGRAQWPGLTAPVLSGSLTPCGYLTIPSLAGAALFLPSSG